MQRPFPVGGTPHSHRGKCQRLCSSILSFATDGRGQTLRTSKSKLAYWPALWGIGQISLFFPSGAAKT